MASHDASSSPSFRPGAPVLNGLIEAGTAALLAWIGWAVVWAGRTSARLLVLESQQDDFKEWMTRIETKLDRVIERQPYRSAPRHD